MNLLLSAEGDRLIIQYAVYAAVIVAGLVALMLLRRAMRPPTHGELKKRLEGFLQEVDAAQGTRVRMYDRIKTASKLLYALDKLVYAASELAQKERDSDIDLLCTLLEQARGELAVFRNGNAAEAERLGCVHDKLKEALALLSAILERDAALKKKLS